MLSAEHFSLENKAVQQLLDIRQREIQYLTERFNAIGVQSSVIAGFVVTTLTALDPVTLEHEPDFSDSITLYTFWLTSALSLSFCVHCIIGALLLATWGPGLSLRGPEGSVSRASYLMTKEKTHIEFAFVGSIVCFVIQVMTAFWIVDKRIGFTGEALASTLVLFFGASISFYIIRRMMKKLQYKPTFALLDHVDKEKFTSRRHSQLQAKLGQPVQVQQVMMTQQTGAAQKSKRSLFPSLSHHKNKASENKKKASEDKNKASEDATHLSHDKNKASEKVTDSKHHKNKSLFPSLSHHRNKASKDATENKLEVQSNAAAFAGGDNDHVNSFSQQGYLEKKGKRTGMWMKSYVCLHQTKLYFFHSEEEYKKYMNAPVETRSHAKFMSLAGYEVLLKTRGNGSHHIVLSQMEYSDDHHLREREFRTLPGDAGSLRLWVKNIMTACLVAHHE